MNGGAGDDVMRGGNGGDRLEGNLARTRWKAAQVTTSSLAATAPLPIR